MEKLLAEIGELKQGDMKGIIDSRIQEFEGLQEADDAELFSELCFCLLTANFQAEKSMKIQSALSTGFRLLSEEELASELKKLGHRFPNMRAKFIVEARQKRKELSGLKALDTQARRDWLVRNVKGLGMKEASHFLRNVGYKDYAIVDFHIVDKLVDSGLIQRPKSRSLSPKQYLSIEQCLKDLGAKAGLSQAELDLYLWYAETGKVLK